MGDPVTWALVISGIGTAANIHSQRKARKSRQRAAEVDRRRRAVESRRAAIANIEQGRVATGSVVNQAAQTGGLGGSGQAGAVGSIQSQTASNLTFNQQLLDFATKTEQHLEKAQLYSWQGQTFASIAQAGMSYASIKAGK